MTIFYKDLLCKNSTSKLQLKLGNNILKIFLVSILITVVFKGETFPGQAYNTPAFNAAAILQDTSNNQTDTTEASSKDDEAFIDTKIQYNAEDSLIMSRTENKVFLYGNAKVVYGDIELTADYIEYSQDSNIVYASGVEDSTGKMVGLPVFKESANTHYARITRYKCKTNRGFIEGVTTKEQEGILHGSTAKKHTNNQFHFKNGKYTTCDKPHPDFYMALTRGKVIPNKRIVAGPTYLVIEDIPLPIGIPFGFFPIQKKQTSGFTNISVNERSEKGFYLQTGYYLGISDYMDLMLTGQIYTQGS